MSSTLISTNNIAQKSSSAMQVDILSQEKYVQDRFEGKQAMVKAGQSYQVPFVHTYETVNPTTTIPTNAFVTPTNFEFHFPKRGARRLKNAFLRIRLNETGGSSSVTLTPAPFWFQRIEIRTQNGVNLIQTLYPWTIWYATAFLPVSRWSTIAALMGTSSSWATSVTLSAGTTKEFYLPLLGSWLDSEIDLEAINDDVVVRCYTQAATASGSGVIGVVSGGIDLWADESTPDDYSDKIMKQIYSNTTQIQQYWDPVLVQTTASLSAGNATKISLQQVQGRCPFLMFGVRANDGATSSQYLTYTALENSNLASGAVDFFDPGNKSVLGGSALSLGNIRYLEFAKQCNSQFSLNNAVYLLPFGKNADQTFADASLANGSFMFDGQQWQLVITPGVGFSTATYYIDIVVWIAKRTAVYPNGNTSVSRNA